MNADPIAWLACATLAYLIVIDLRSRETLRYGASVAMRVLTVLVAIPLAVLLIVCVVAGLLVAAVRDDGAGSAP